MKGRYAGEKNAMYGRHLPHTQEWKQWASQRFSGSGNPMYGVHREKTKEECIAISQRQKGTGNSFYGKHHSDDARKQISNSKKKTPVKCIETGISYDSASEACRLTGIHNSSILRAAKNQLTAGGYHWEIVA